VCLHPSVSLNKEKVCHEISEDKIAVCEKTQGLRSGNFSDLNSACSTVLVPVKIFQFQDMHYENRFLGTFQGHSKRPIIQYLYPRTIRRTRSNLVAIVNFDKYSFNHFNSLKYLSTFHIKLIEHTLILSLTSDFVLLCSI
jgi:hypothetical protein